MECPARFERCYIKVQRTGRNDNPINQHRNGRYRFTDNQRVPDVTILPKLVPLAINAPGGLKNSLSPTVKLITGPFEPSFITSLIAASHYRLLKHRTVRTVPGIIIILTRLSTYLVFFYRSFADGNLSSMQAINF